MAIIQYTNVFLTTCTQQTNLKLKKMLTTKKIVSGLQLMDGCLEGRRRNKRGAVMSCEGKDGVNLDSC